MYMSYCRMEGTRHELAAVLSAVEEHVNGEAEFAVSDNEIQEFRYLVSTFSDWLHDMALVDDQGYIDDDALDQVCADMAHGYDAADYDD